MEASTIMELTVKEIHKAFMDEDGKVTEVLKNISFEAEKGEFICLLGPSGCGKTTLLTIIAGFQKYDSGSISVEGKEVTKQDRIEVLYSKIMPCFHG